MYYEDIFREYERAKIRYIVAGGVAAVLHGVSRLTLDLDLIVDFSTDNLRVIKQSMAGLGYQLRQPVELEQLSSPAVRLKLIDEKNLKAITYNHSSRHQQVIDILIDIPLAYNDLVKNIHDKRAAGITIPMISIDDLITLKQAANREKDKMDIAVLNRIRKNQGHHE